MDLEVTIEDKTMLDNAIFCEVFVGNKEQPRRTWCNLPLSKQEAIDLHNLLADFLEEKELI